jgi:hypothetical protein
MRCELGLIPINAVVFTDFQWGTSHLDEKSASPTCALLQIPSRNDEMPVVPVAGYTGKWITSDLTVSRKLSDLSQ